MAHAAPRGGASARTNSRVSAPRPWAVVLAGGAGSRFWPLSTPSRPKQLLPLAGEQALVEDAVRRACLTAPIERVRILTNQALVGPIREATGLGRDSFLVEPRPRGTAPALAWAAWWIKERDPNAVMTSLHADHAISPESAFQGTALEAARLAVAEDLLFAIGAPPDRPETGFGYIRAGEAIQARGGRTASRALSFVEKPAAGEARRLLESGCAWNTGIFVWQPARFLAEVKRWAPRLHAAIGELDRGDVAGFFRRAPKSTVDDAILSRSARVGAVLADFSWDDIGSWEALARTRPRDPQGNVVLSLPGDLPAPPDIVLRECSGNIVVAEGVQVSLVGARDLVVVGTPDRTLAMPRAAADGYRELLGIRGAGAARSGRKGH